MHLCTLWVGNVSHATPSSTMRWFCMGLGIADGLVDVKMEHRGGVADNFNSFAFLKFDSAEHASRARDALHRSRPSASQQAWTVKFANADTTIGLTRRVPPTPPPSPTAVFAFSKPLMRPPTLQPRPPSIPPPPWRTPYEQSTPTPNLQPRPPSIPTAVDSTAAVSKARLQPPPLQPPPPSTPTPMTQPRPPTTPPPKRLLRSPTKAPLPRARSSSSGGPVLVQPPLPPPADSPTDTVPEQLHDQQWPCTIVGRSHVM
jgi:hypothetical protein